MGGTFVYLYRFNHFDTDTRCCKMVLFHAAILDQFFWFLKRSKILIFIVVTALFLEKIKWYDNIWSIEKHLNLGVIPLKSLRRGREFSF